MTDAAQANAPVFAIQRMYLKDMSLELPNAPQIFLEQAAPAVEVQLDVANNTLADGIYEATVRITVTTKINDKVAFLIEATQGGIFEMRNIPEEQMPLLLNVVCPNIIYPYLRSNVADAVQRTGFPPMHLAEINFEALYQQKLAAEAQSGGNSAGIVLPAGVKH